VGWYCEFEGADKKKLEKKKEAFHRQEGGGKGNPRNEGAGGKSIHFVRRREDTVLPRERVGNSCWGREMGKGRGNRGLRPPKKW